MSDYIIEYEPAIAAGTLATGDLFRVYDLSAKAYRSATGADMRKLATSGLVNCTDATLTVTEAAHAGGVITLNRAGGIAVTLPAATGTGNVYRFIVGTTFTSAATIKVANSSDTLIGTATLFQDAGDTVVGFAAGGTDDTLTFTSTNTTGGIAGAEAIFTDIAANRFHVRYVSDAAGTEATPFSATV